MQNFKSQIYFISHTKFKLSFNFITDTLPAFVNTHSENTNPYCLIELIQFIVKVSARYKQGYQIILERFR